MNISELQQYMGNVDIEAEIVNMNSFMLVVKDKTGQTFVRYRKIKSTDSWKKLLANLKIGNIIKITNCKVVNYHGILQLKLTGKGEVISIQSKTHTDIK